MGVYLGANVHMIVRSGDRFAAVVTIVHNEDIGLVTLHVFPTPDLPIGLNAVAEYGFADGKDLYWEWPPQA